jgi:orotate phosphoribosyltransferase
MPLSKQSSPRSSVIMSPAQEQLRDILKQKSVCHGDFTLASGARSDFYVDAKLTTSDPEAAMLVGRVGWEVIRKTAAARKVSVNSIGGLTMGADWIALSIGIAAHLEDSETILRVFSVRKAAKEHGRLKRIEGNFSPGDWVVVVEDVITTGGSAIEAIDAIEQARRTGRRTCWICDRAGGPRRRRPRKDRETRLRSFSYLQARGSHRP